MKGEKTTRIRQCFHILWTYEAYFIHDEVFNNNEQPTLHDTCMHASICTVGILNIFLCQHMQISILLFPMKERNVILIHNTAFFIRMIWHHTFLSHFYRKLCVIGLQFYDYFLCAPSKESGCAEFGRVLMGQPACVYVYALGINCMLSKI